MRLGLGLGLGLLPRLALVLCLGLGLGLLPRLALVLCLRNTETTKQRNTETKNSKC